MSRPFSHADQLVVVQKVTKATDPNISKCFHAHSSYIGVCVNRLTPRHVAFRPYTNPSTSKTIRLWHYVCDCSCGGKAYPPVSKFLSGKIQSCGCANVEATKKASTKHGHYGKEKQASGNVVGWLRCMWTRCYDKSSSAYPRYGGRGIRLCRRWNYKAVGVETAVENFVSDMGARPEGMTLDRIDNDRGYAKWNTRWATAKKQNNNRRNVEKMTYKGKSKTLTQWAKELKLPYGSLRARLKRGWSIEKTLETPVRAMARY